MSRRSLRYIYCSCEGAKRKGIFGALNIEWVHFFWNSLVLVAVILLLTRFRRNPWLWLTLLASGWHGLEHGYILATYLRTGIEGAPGLLSAGGAIASGLPASRPDLHFFYNLVETMPLVIAFLYRVASARSSPVPLVNRIQDDPAFPERHAVSIAPSEAHAS